MLKSKERRNEFVRKTKTKAIGIMCLVLVLAVTLIVGGCAKEVPPTPPPTPPPTEPAPGAGEPIQMGRLCTLTGPIASTILPSDEAIIDYWKYVNDEKGGILGHPVELTTYDTSYAMDKYMKGYKLMAAKNPVCIFYENSGCTNTMKWMFERDHIVGFAMSTGAKMYPPTWLFFVNPGYAEGYIGFAKFLKKEWDKEHPGVTPKWGWCTWDNSTGKGPLRMTRWLEENGWEYTSTQYIPFAPVDTTTQLKTLHDQGTNFVACNIGDAAESIVLKDAERLGYLKDMKFLGTHYTAQQALVEEAGAAAAEGFSSWDCWPLPTMMDVPGIKLMNEISQKYRGHPLQQKMGVGSTAEAVIVEEALKRCLEKGIWPVTGDDLKESLESMKDWDPMGLAAKVTFSPEEHNLRYAYAARIVNGKMVKISDWTYCPKLSYEEYKPGTYE